MRNVLLKQRAGYLALLLFFLASCSQQMGSGGSTTSWEDESYHTRGVMMNIREGKPYLPR